MLALKTLPQIIAAIVGLIALCALMALALTHLLPLDFSHRLSGDQPRGAGYGGDNRRRYPGGYVFYHGDANAAPVYHIAHRPGHRAVNFALCAAQRKKAPVEGGLITEGKRLRFQRS